MTVDDFPPEIRENAYRIDRLHAKGGGAFVGGWVVEGRYLGFNPYAVQWLKAAGFVRVGKRWVLADDGQATPYA